MIYFFYPSKMMGGAEYLIINSANLLDNSGFEVGIIDFQTGWVLNNKKLNESIIKKNFFDDEKFLLKDEDILVTTANYIYKLDLYFKKSNAKILLWAVHPYNVVLKTPNLWNIHLFIWFSKLYLKIFKYRHENNLKIILGKNALVAMDGECNIILNLEYKLKYNRFLPIFIEQNNFIVSKIKKDESLYNMVWLGRLDTDFKIHILKKVLLDINLIKDQFKKSVVFRIIGDGPGANNIKEFVKKEINFDVLFMNELIGEELNQVVEKSDIGFAMGTSALNIAAKKIPVVLLDFSYNEVVNYRYRWLFEASDFVLGRDIELLQPEEISLMKTMHSLINDFSKNSNIIAERCFEYAYNNHHEKMVLSSLINCIESTKLTMNDIYKYRWTKPIWSQFANILFRLNK